MLTAAANGDIAMSEPILIWGAGAIGGTLGAYWARAGVPVLLVDVVGRACAGVPHRRAGDLRAGRGVQGRDPGGRRRMSCSGVYRRIVLAVKAPATEAALEQLAPHLAPDGFVLSAQNGLNEIAIAEKVGAERTMGCFVNFGADWLGPGQILFGNRGAVVVGEIDGVDPRAHARDARAARDVRARRGADRQHLGLSVGQARLWGDAVRDRADQRLDGARISPIRGASSVFDTLGREVMAVAKARGVKPVGFKEFDPDAFTPGASEQRSRAAIAALADYTSHTAKTHSGIWRDLAVRKRKTEVDPQIGIIGKLGREAGIATPAIDRLVALIHDIEDGRRPLSFATFQELIDTCTSATTAASRS